VPNKTYTTLVAAYRNATDAQAAATDLQAAGISRDDIYIEKNGPDQGSQSRSKNTPNEGGFTGWFKSIFANEDDADRSRYERAISEGDTLVGVEVDEDEIGAVEDILNRHSPIDVHAEDVGTERATNQATNQRSDQSKAIPVVKEDVQIGKRQVLRGGIRVYSRVVDEPVEETVHLREEHARVERRPVNRAATDADLASGKQQVIEVQEFAEEPVVGKQARVVEEVRVGKDVSERTETVRENARHTEVNVEKTSGDKGAIFDDSDFRSDYQKRYASGGVPYDTYLPAYQYGYESASNPRYRGRSFDEIESDLRTDYGRRYPNSTWEKMKDAIRYGWDKVTGKTKAATR